MKNAKKLSIMLLLVFATMQCWSQASIERWVIGSLGGSYANGTWLMDYTAGETVTATISNANNTLTQGFQQAGGILVSVNERPQSDVQVSIYPNPSTDVINISIGNMDADKVVVSIFDLVGQMLDYREFDVNPGQGLQGTFEMGRYATGTYYLRVSAGKDFSEVYKVVKINE